MICIRRATLSDLDHLTPLFDAYRVFYGQPSAPQQAKAFLSERLRLHDSVIFLAWEDNQAIGFTQLFPIFTSVGLGRSWLLNDLYVSASHRQKGVATQLLEAAKNHGRETGAQWLMLETACDNRTAQALYQRNGWQRSEDLFYHYNLTSSTKAIQE